MNAPEHEHEHRGTFAEGQAVEEHHPEASPRGDYARGQDQPTHTHEGSFGEGQSESDHHPEREAHGRFSDRS